MISEKKKMKIEMSNKLHLHILFFKATLLTAKYLSIPETGHLKINLRLVENVIMD